LGHSENVAYGPVHAPFARAPNASKGTLKGPWNFFGGGPLSPSAWYNGIAGRAKRTIPVKIQPKNPNHYPIINNILLNKAKEGLQPIVKITKTWTVKTLPISQ
jgi:hypothetical protein